MVRMFGQFANAGRNVIMGTKTNENSLDGLDASEIDIGDAPKVIAFDEIAKLS